MRYTRQHYTFETPSVSGVPMPPQDCIRSVAVSTDVLVSFGFNDCSCLHFEVVTEQLPGVLDEQAQPVIRQPVAGGSVRPHRAMLK